MHDIYTQSLRYVLESVGVNYLPQEWMRGTIPVMDVPANQLNPQGPQRGRGAAAAPVGQPPS